MTIVSVAAPQKAAAYHAEVHKLLRPFAEMFSPALPSLLLYVGLLYPAGPELGVNPHPQLLSSLIEWAREAGVGKISLAGRAAPGFTFRQSWRIAGYEALPIAKLHIIDLALAPLQMRACSLALACRELALPQPLLQADCCINVGKFRAAEGRLFGSALLNLAAMTELPVPAEVFPRALIDLYSIIVPDLHVIDALRGGRGWQPQQADALLGARDAVALDMTLMAVVGLPAESFEPIALASQYGLCGAGAADIYVAGDTQALFAQQAQRNQPQGPGKKIVGRALRRPVKRL